MRFVTVNILSIASTPNLLNANENYKTNLLYSFFHDSKRIPNGPWVHLHLGNSNYRGLFINYLYIADLFPRILSSYYFPN